MAIVGESGDGPRQPGLAGRSNLPKARVTALTPAQSAAIEARGNVLLEAGAGAGKTSTLVARCLARVFSETEPVSLEEILMVTFTEAAAAEMRRRIREALNARAASEPANPRLAEQLALLDQARIGTLHSFCFRLVRDHFHELGLDPQSQVLDEGEARLLAAETASDLIDRHFAAGPADARPVLELIRRHGAGESESIESLVIAVHHRLQTLPDPDGWLAREEQAWAQFDPRAWEAALVAEFRAALPDWREQLAAQPADNLVAHRCAQELGELRDSPARSEIAGVCGEMAGLRADEHWQRNKGRHRDPILNVLEEAAVLASFALPGAGGVDPLEADFRFMQPHVLALLGLVREFGKEFALRKRQRAGLDFSDLEQCSLRLLWDAAANAPTATARHWRESLRAVFVDEYQDINEAQDRIIAAISREGAAANRFLVGDVKQSIYGFRLARPDIFLRYARTWRAAGGAGQVLPLSDNFRSHEAILEFVNRCFVAVSREDLGGIGYPTEAHLRFGDPTGRAQLSRAADPAPRVELCLRLTAPRRASRETDDGEDSATDEELTNAELEAILTANRLRQLKEAGTQIYDRESKALRPVRWGDMAILLRATSGKAEVFAQTFARAGIPLAAGQRGFFDALEISDFVNLFLLLDNPQQDIPLLAVLRSPLVGLTPDELATIRAGAPAERSYWTALNRHQELPAAAPARTFEKVQRFLEAFGGWRERVRRGSLSQCLEDILDRTHYLTWLETQPRGRQQSGNVQRLLELTRHYDSWQGRGLHRFLKYVRLLDEDGEGPEPAAPITTDAVRLMTIHASKGLEFPVVVLAGLNRPFRMDAPGAGFVIDDELGICPEVFPVERHQHYPSVSLLRAQRRQRQRTIAEEIRLLYVALTRACDRLILLGTAAGSRALEKWSQPLVGPLSRQQLAQARSPLDLIGPLLPALCQREDWFAARVGVSEVVVWRVFGGDETISLDQSAPVEAPAASRPSTGRELELVNRRVTQPYPFVEATRQAGKTTVTRIRRQLTELDDREAGELFLWTRASEARRPSPKLSAAEVGTAHHTFFQKLSFDAVHSLDDLAREADRLVARGDLSAEERRVLQLDRVREFWSAPVGGAILERRSNVQRELEFTSGFPVSELAELAELAGGSVASPSSADQVLVQGIVDLAVIGPGDIWIIDYKTDDVPAPAVAERAQRYRPQVELYRRALARIYGRPVTRVWLHFLSPGITVDLSGMVSSV